MHRPILLFLLAALLGAGLAGPGCRTAPAGPAAAGPLIFISIDGFRWDYLQQHDAPVLRRLAAAGVHATRLTPSFPTKTFPNHYTLATGLRPAHHGIVGNWFYDPALGDTFAMSKPESNSEERWWSQGEPVWITAERQGVRSFCYYWPGSEAPHHGVRPSRFMPYDPKTASPPPQRVAELLGWLALPAAERPRLCTLYFEAVDNAGHNFGPDAPETARAVQEIDACIGRLLEGLGRLGLRDQANLVLVSDHGMSPCGPDRVIFLEDLVDAAQVEVDSTGPTAGVRPKPGTLTAAALAASIRAKAPPQLQVYLREETPARFHYRDNPRIADVVLVADDHWNIESRTGWPARVPTYHVASHGWDPATPNMGALFIASGPAFRHGVELPEVENIHVYNLLCAVLGVQPAPNDGDQSLVRAALRR